jgi:hypothetical protein
MEISSGDIKNSQTLRSREMKRGQLAMSCYDPKKDLHPGMQSTGKSACSAGVLPGPALRFEKKIIP